MTPDDVKARLLGEITLRGYADQYIDRNEEREILQIAIQLGVGVEAARGHLAAVCGERGYVLESAIARVMAEQLREVIGQKGRVDRGAFDRIVSAALGRMRGKKSPREVKKILLTVMEDTGHNRVKTGWFGNWYAALKRELGVG
jgi:hypothetical protein